MDSSGAFRYDPELCAEQKLDMRGMFEAAKLRHAALGMAIDDGDDYGEHVGLQRHRRAVHEGQAAILAMWEEALDA